MDLSQLLNAVWVILSPTLHTPLPSDCRSKWLLRWSKSMQRPLDLRCQLLSQLLGWLYSLSAIQILVTLRLSLYLVEFKPSFYGPLPSFSQVNIIPLNEFKTNSDKYVAIYVGFNWAEKQEVWFQTAVDMLYIVKIGLSIPPPTSLVKKRSLDHWLCIDYRAYTAIE